MKKYVYKDDDGNTIEVSFDRMINEGQMLEHRGKLYRRVHEHTTRKPKAVRQNIRIVSDSLGFTKSQLGDMRNHLDQSGVKGVEFKQDPQVPGFYQVHCGSRKAYNEYAKSRQMVDRNSRSCGATISAKDIENAMELVRR